MTSRTWFIQLIGLLMLVLVIMYSIPILSQKIDLKIRDYIQDTLHQQNHLWAKVDVQNRHVSIKGNTPDINEHKQVIKKVNDLWFVKNTNDQISPIIIKPYKLVLHWDSNTLSTQGYTENHRSKRTLQKLINTEFSGKTLDNNISLGVGAPPKWQQLTQVLLQQIKDLQLASVYMIDQMIHIQGKANNRKEIEKLKQSLAPFRKENYHFTIEVIALNDYGDICQSKFDTLIKASKIHFKTGKADIDPQSYNLLNDIANTAVFCAKSTISVVGHTDNRGDDLANKELSLQRAKAVKGWLFSQGGIPLERLKTIGKGSSEPISSNDTKQGQEENRRIEFIVEGG